jgi:hypothetical protein
MNERVMSEVGPNKMRSMSWERQFFILYHPHSVYALVLKMEAADFNEMLVMIYQTPRSHSQEILIVLVTAMKTSNLTVALYFD